MQVVSQVFSAKTNTCGLKKYISLMHVLSGSGGVDPSIRKDVWKFLFGMYPYTSTTRERKVLALEHHVRYKMMKHRWLDLIPSSMKMRVDETDSK